MSRRLLLVRHGQTAWNAERRAQGQIDVPLDELGHRQAAELGPALATLRPAGLWSSDLVRAMRTAEYVAAATGLRVVPDPRLRENDLGPRSGLTPAEYQERYPEEHALWQAGDDPPPGAETREAMLARAVPALRDCLSALAPGETGVVVGHGWCLRAAIVALLGWPTQAEGTVRGLENCGWATLEEGEDGTLRLLGYNQTAGPRGPAYHPGTSAEIGGVSAEVR